MNILKLINRKRRSRGKKQLYFDMNLSPFLFEYQNEEIEFNIIRYQRKRKEEIKFSVDELESFNVFDPQAYKKSQL